MIATCSGIGCAEGLWRTGDLEFLWKADRLQGLRSDVSDDLVYSAAN